MRILLSLLVPIVACGVAFSSLRSTSAEPTAATTAATITFDVDPVHSSMIFRVRYAGISTFFGRFNEVSGTFAIDEANLAKSTFDLRIKTASVDSGNKRRDGHLSSPDFFSAKQYPEISFVSTSVTAKGKSLEVTGDLTLRGVTKSVTASVIYGGQTKGQRGGLRAGLDGKLTIAREEFGVKFGEGTLGSEVTIEMGLVGTKK